MSDLMQFPVFVCAVLSLLMTCVWGIFNIQSKRMLIVSACFLCLFAALFYGYYLAVINVFYFGFPIHLISPVSLATALIFVVGNVKGKRTIVKVLYLLNTALLIFALAGLQLSGGYSIIWSEYIVFNALLVLQFLTYAGDSNRLGLTQLKHC